MKKEKIVKIMLIVLMSALLIVASTQVFAADNDYIDLSGNVNLNTNTNTPVENTPANNTPVNNTPVNNTPVTNTNTNNNSTYNTNLPKTGVEDTSFVAIAVIVLIGVAVFAFKKVNEYKNI